VTHFWIIGQAFSSRADEHSKPLEGKVGEVLATHLRVSTERLRNKCVLINLLDAFPGKNGKGDAFPMAAARKSAARVMAKLERGDFALLLGWNVAQAFGLRRDGRKYFDRFAFGDGASAVVMPHPSGVNMWWNVEVNRKKAKRELGKLSVVEGLRQ
jgi:uracil-DNA glycosylase